ncbi:telomere stability and silencing-domain-containing protein [Auriculariales sp. MPI-PUGE-AT-0066]|nr:telomere stability and silencing-domain-containing protein [Auriculariales sp. MPI-PUGE-AT-0066]
MSSTTNVLVATFAPFSTLALNVPSTTLVGALPALLQQHEPRLPMWQLRLSHARTVLDPTAPLSSYALSSDPLALRLAPAVRGGKGGFGSQLRAAGGRMSSRRTNNTDSCRDLNGRRLGTVKEAEKLAAYLESEPERKKAQHDAKKAKLEALERQLGIGKDGKPLEDAEGAGGTQAGKKRRFDDTKFLEETQEIVDGVRNAVAAGLLKKRKKAKLDAEATSVTTGSTAAAATKAIVESSATAPVAAVASLAVGIAAA